MIAVGVVELALVHEGVVVGVTDPPASGAGAVDELVDRLAAAQVERDSYLRGGTGSADEDDEDFESKTQTFVNKMRSSLHPDPGMEAADAARLLQLENPVLTDPGHSHQVAVWVNGQENHLTSRDTSTCIANRT